MTYSFSPTQFVKSAPWAKRDQRLAARANYKQSPTQSAVQSYDVRVISGLLKVVDLRILNNVIDKVVDDTKITSSPTMIRRKPSFCELVAMGDVATKELLQRIERGDVRLVWLLALRQITQENPVPQHSSGIIREMGECWVNWGRKNGFL